MKELIVTDEAGVEIRREKIGRGRPKRSWTKRDDGNYVVVERTDPIDEVVELHQPIK